PSSRRVLVAVAWPYAQGPLHLGHMAGAYLPADIFARYHRSAGNDVLMVSGSDQHGTPITFRADQEGVTPQEVVDRFHPEFLSYWRDLGISFDLFTTTGTKNHERVTHDMFLRLRDNGYLYKETSRQLFDPETERFLPDRYVEGTCPHCGYEAARGDQCDNCGRTLDPQDLIDPRSKLSGAKPVMKDTEHYFLRLSALQDELLEWLESRRGWRKHVQNSAVGFVKEGLLDRAITRDIGWGVSVPVDDLGPGKRIYVWFEAVIGYLSAAKEWSQLEGDPERWRAWWEDSNALSYYFVGKDNIPFHTIIWPAMLMGYGGLNLPTDVPANQYVTFRGEKASKSRGVGKSVLWYLDRFEVDALRYALATNLPEQGDTDLTDAEMVRRVNEELVATWGNLVHRAVSMTRRYFGGVVPEPEGIDDRDRALLAGVDEALVEVGEQVEAVRLKAGLATAMGAAQDTNVYLSQTEPWKTAESDQSRTGTTLWVVLNAIARLNVAFSPYLPFTAQRVHGLLGFQGGYRRSRLAAAAGGGGLPARRSRPPVCQDGDGRSRGGLTHRR
ncbi:MAG: methionine--tRNA ligase, partial [Acidimicrobiia bacterium]